MPRWKSTAAIAVIAALALTGCASGGDSSDSDGGERSLVISNTTAPATLEASGANWGGISPYYQAVYDTLLLATSEGTIEPFLAQDWSYNDDNTVLTLDLRTDVTFTDGSSLTAELVKENLERFRAGTSTNAGLLSGITSIEATDDATVVITLAAPDPALLSYLTRDAGLVAAESSFTNPEAPTEPVGSGPYILDLDRTVTGTSYVYTKNPDYWNPELQHYDTLTISVLTDATATLNAALAGELDVVRIGSNTAVPEYERADWQISTNSIDVHGLILYDRAGSMIPALGDVRVRRAINLAIDREGLLSALQDGMGTPTTQMFPDRSVGFDAELDDAYPYDPDAAKELLAEAGYADGFTVTIPTTSALPPTTFSLVQQQLADVGITVELDDAGSNYISNELLPKYGMSYQPLEQTPDWQLIQYILSPTATWNPTRYEDETVNALIQTIQYGTTDEAETATRELNAYIVDQAWFAPWYRQDNNFASNAETSVTMMPTNIYPAIYDFAPAS
jgi:peptide/nickel transport system substrate-binding protein